MRHIIMGSILFFFGLFMVVCPPDDPVQMGYGVMAGSVAAMVFMNLILCGFFEEDFWEV